MSWICVWVYFADVTGIYESNGFQPVKLVL